MQIHKDSDGISTFYRTISGNVQRLRKQRKMSQLDLATSMGHSSAAFVAKAEQLSYGKHFNLEHLYQIAHIFEIDVCELLRPCEES